MADAIDLDFHEQSDTIIEPGHDLELDHLNDGYLHASDNTPRSIDSNIETSVFNDALASQYNYPPPHVDYNRYPYIHPDSSVQRSEQKNPPKHVYPDSTWTKHFFEGDKNAPLSQLVSRHEQEQTSEYVHQRDVYETQNAVDDDLNPTVQRQRRFLGRYQNHAHMQTPSYPRRAIQPAIDRFRDGSILYVPGHGARREDELQHMMDAMTTAIERPCFTCDECGKDFKTRSDLSHHKIKHDPKRTHQHKCRDCPAAFRYPKDLRRHVESKHSEEQHALHACNECDKVYKRKDHLDRHAKQKGHYSSSQTAPSLPTSPLNPATSTKTTNRRNRAPISLLDSRIPGPPCDSGAQRIVRNEQTMSPQNPSRLRAPQFSLTSYITGLSDDAFTVSDADSQSFSQLDPSLLQIPMRSPTSFYTAGSMGDALTISDIDSFWSEPI